MIDPILKRRAVRSYESEKLSNDEVEKLIAAFQASPAALGKFEVIQAVSVMEDKYLQEVENVTNNAAYNAPFMLIIAGQKDSPFSAYDAAVAAENVMIEAFELGLGSVFVMGGAIELNKHKDVLKNLGIEDGYKVEAIIPVGKIKGKVATPDRTNRYKLIQR